jgi:hypothetical protein
MENTESVTSIVGVAAPVGSAPGQGTGPRGRRFSQLDDGRVGVAEHRRVGAPGGLDPESGVQLGDTVAQGVDPQRRDGIEVPFPVGVVLLAPLGPLNHEGRVVHVCRHVGEPVPYDGRVTLGPGLRGGPAHAQNVDAASPAWPMRGLRENGSWT